MVLEAVAAVVPAVVDTVLLVQNLDLVHSALEVVETDLEAVETVLEAVPDHSTATVEILGCSTCSAVVGCTSVEMLVLTVEHLDLDLAAQVLAELTSLSTCPKSSPL